jgi:SAM-dependent methyltransferase
MLTLTNNKKSIMDFFDKIADKREKWIKRNKYYYRDLKKFFRYAVPENSSILEIGCGTGDILNSLQPSIGMGVDFSDKMVKIAKNKYPNLIFKQMDAEDLNINKKFDFIIISDVIGYFEDVQRALEQLHKVSHEATRIIITYQNFIWNPVFFIIERLRLKTPTKKLNWLNLTDIENLLNLTGFDIIKTGRRFLFPKFFPFISWLCNRFLVHIPGFNIFGITGYIIAREQINRPSIDKLYSVSVIIPARNEMGNIENAVKRLPVMGKHTEIIFVEGNSTDTTLNEIKRVCKKYSKKIDVKYTVQDGKGKGDAVRKGFSIAKGEILMILDADLTVPPEDLPKFYNVIASGKGEYINGSRLVYPMEEGAMQLLNIIGNKFFSMMFTWILDQRLKDTLCGTKVLTKKNWEIIGRNRSYFGDFDPFGDFDMIFGSAKMNLKIIEIPIRYHAREYGDTNISRFRHGWLLLKMTFFALHKIKFI